ncbi:BamA/TamA family outer membrane protein [bacterium]|nr:BamA/TamA family outer membrane protein [bacterium]MBU1983158.1 BamA/TamA family outer membrane protein [bacterium]
MRAVIVIGIVLLQITAVRGETIQRVVFHGNRHFSRSELTSLLVGGERLSSDSNLIEKYLSAFEDSLIARDFVFACVDSIRVEYDRRDRAILSVYVYEGAPARLESVEWLGDSLLIAPNQFARIVTRSGEVFRWNNLEYDIQSLLDYFENGGYPFAEIEVQTVVFDSTSETVALRLVIRAGPRTTVEFLSFSGVTQTRTSFLTRETRLRLGSPYRQNQVEAARRRLNRLEFIERADPPDVVLDDAGRTGVRFPLKESRSTRLDIVAGYLPETESRGAALTGLANIELLNLFGMGRKAVVHWERPDRRIQAVEVSYREPWILGQPLAIRVDFGQRIEDTLYVTRRFAGRVEVDVLSNVRLWGTVQREAVVADSLSSVLLNLPDSRTTYVESGLSFDTRDHPTNPRGGVLFSTFAGTGFRKRDETVGEEAAGSFRHQRGGIDSEAAQEVFPFWIAYAGLHARVIETTEPQVLLPDLYRLGGARSLRGYREEQFLGSRIGWTSAELRYWLGPTSRFFVFWDAGSVYREKLAAGLRSQSTLFRMAGGLGLRIGTDIGIWGFDYGVGEEDRPLNGKLHVSLRSTF